MVMATETRETSRNGKRSRGSSPSTNTTNNNNSSNKVPSTVEDLTPETSDDDSHSKKNLSTKQTGKNGKSEYEEKIRVGKDYQVITPEYGTTRPDNYPDKALLVWSPVKDIPDSRLEEYISLAKERYGYNAEQALGMLFWHKHDLEKAVQDLANFTPFPDEWTKEDKVLFEQAFQFHGKSFHRIRQMLPDKNIASLVKFYYSWKKTRSRTSVMDRQEKKKNEGGSENGSENGGSPEDSDVEDKIDSDDDNQVKDNGTIANIEEIIGVPPVKESPAPTKTSIMTTSTGKSLKRKHPECELEKIDTEKILILDDDDAPEEKQPKLSEIASATENKPEITLTPIPKVSAVVEDKRKSVELTTVD